mmetsp:Transcript_10579/g.16572  ORF Transcript_10579/g.16572 Transcript_10579/m.16572 type:complete len:204 (-) Transcript_10579:132-743(-)
MASRLRTKPCTRSLVHLKFELRFLIATLCALLVSLVLTSFFFIFSLSSSWVRGLESSSSSSSPSSSDFSSPLLSSVSILGAWTLTVEEPTGMLGPRPRGLALVSLRSALDGASSSAVSCSLIALRTSSVARCSIIPRKVIMLFSVIIGFPLASHWKESFVLMSRLHPSSSCILLTILRISRSFVLSSSSISDSSSALACVCAN